jgi:hypothetical protein
VKFSVSGSGCFLNASSLVGNFVTTCIVTARKEASGGYSSEDSAPVSFLIGQQPLVISNTELKGQAGKNIQLYSSGGNGVNGVYYEVTGTDCSLNSTQVFARSATTCQVTATQSWLADGVVKQSTSSPVNFTFYRLDPSPFVLKSFTLYSANTAAPATNIYPVGTWIVIATDGGSMLAGGAPHESGISYSASGSGCVMGTKTLRGVNAFSANAPTTCVITATKLASFGYNAITTATINYVFDNVEQLPLLISTSNASTAPLGSSFPLSTVGGSGTGSVSYSVTGANCQINVTYLIGSAATICSVTATKAASTGYKATSSPPVNFVFALLDQEPLVISNPDESRTSGNHFLLTTTGGSGTGAVKFTISGTNCSLSTMNYLMTNNWSDSALCVVTASKAASTGYKIATSATRSFTFTKPIVPVNQATLTISNSITISDYYNNFKYRYGKITLTSAGGSGDGSVTYSVTSSSAVEYGPSIYGLGACQINKDPNTSMTQIWSNVPAKCVITAKKSASIGFNEAVSAPKEFTFTASPQSGLGLTYKIGFSGKGGVDGFPALLEDVYLSTTFYTFLDSPGGNITYSVSGQDCIKPSESYPNRVTANSPTTCTVTATRDGGRRNINDRSHTGYFYDVTRYYLPITSTPITISFAMRDQKPLALVTPDTTSTAFKVGDVVKLYSQGGSGDGSINFNVVGNSCTVQGGGSSPSSYGTVSASSESTCVVTAVKSVAPGQGYNSAVTSPSLTFYFTRP